MAALIQYANGVPAIKFTLDELQTLIGRGLDSDICVVDKYASKNHAVIEIKQRSDQKQKEFIIRDLDSTNHTYVNDTPVKSVCLKDKDIIRIGEEEFVFESTHGTESEDLTVADLKAFPGQEENVDRMKETMKEGPELNTRFSRRLRLL